VSVINTLDFAEKITMPHIGIHAQSCFDPGYTQKYNVSCRGSMFNLVYDPGYTQKYNVSYRGSMFNLVFDPGFILKSCNASDRGSMFNLVVIQYYTDHASV
jgi:hypothetical protein